MANRLLTRKKWYKGGGPGLIAAVKANDVNLVKQKLTTIFGRYFGRSDVNSIDKETGKSALIIAAENDFREIFKILLDHKADTKIRDLTNKNVFYYLNSETATILCEFLVKIKQGISIKAFTNFDDSLIPFFTVAFTRLSYSKDDLAELVSRTGSLDAKKTMFNLFIQNPPIPNNIKLFIETDTSLYFLHQIINYIGLMDIEVKVAVLKYVFDHKLVDEARQLLSDGTILDDDWTYSFKKYLWHNCVTNNLFDVISRLLFKPPFYGWRSEIDDAFRTNNLELENVIFNHWILINNEFDIEQLKQVLKLGISNTQLDSHYIIAIKERVNKLLSKSGNTYNRFTAYNYKTSCTKVFQACLKYNFTDELKMMLNATDIEPDPIYYIVDGELQNFNIDDEKVDIFVDFISHAVKRVPVNPILGALNALISLRNYYYFDTIIRKLNDKNSLRDFKVVDLVRAAVHIIGNNGTNFETLLLLLNNGFSYDNTLHADTLSRSILKYNSELQSVLFEYILSKVSEPHNQLKQFTDLHLFLGSGLSYDVIHQRIYKIIHNPSYFKHKTLLTTPIISGGWGETCMANLCALYGIDLLDFMLEKSSNIEMAMFSKHGYDDKFNLPLKFEKPVLIRLLNYFELKYNSGIFNYFQHFPKSEDIYTEYILPIIIKKNIKDKPIAFMHLFGTRVKIGPYSLLEAGILSNSIYIVKSLLELDADYTKTNPIVGSTLDMLILADDSIQMLFYEHFVSKNDNASLTDLTNRTKSPAIRTMLLQKVAVEFLSKNTYRKGFPKIFIEKEETPEYVKMVYIEKLLQNFQEMYPKLTTGNIKKDRLLDGIHRLTILMLGVNTWRKSDEPSKFLYFDLIGKFIFELIKIVNPIEGEKIDLTIEDIYIFYFSIENYADDFYSSILSEKTFFIDYYEKTLGFNYLICVINATHVHSDIRLPIIRALITKKININAVDKDGNTVLHHALKLNKTGLCSDDIVEILINHPLICPYIKNNTGQSAIDITNRIWVEKIEGQKTGQINVATIKWKGLTRKWINQLIDFYFASKTGLFYNPANQVYCLSCLGQGARPSACDHVTGHNCSDSYRSKLSDYARRGGIPPGFNRDLLYNGESECCARCNEKTAAPSCRYGCRGDFQCMCGLHFGADAYKYYKLYKMIERFATYQDAQLDRLFIDVWLDVTNFGASVPFNRQACVDFRQNVERTKTFIPAAILDRFPNVEETDIYPSGFKATPIPNMRRTDDVITNNLMPSIIDYGAVEELNNIDWESYSRFINFRHRKNIKPDFPINEHRDRGVGFVCNTVKENTRIKCLNADEKRPEKLCDSYLFPDELGILVSSGDLDHESYILYRDKFMYSEILDFDSAAYPYFIGQSIKKPNIMSVQSACEGGSSSHAGGTRRSRRKVKSVRRTKRS